jgi:hypothetical protein
MDTSRFTKPEDEFSLLGRLTARFAFKTESSISFEIGRFSHSRFTFTTVGWIDVHHPCDSFIKAQVRICIPVGYHSVEQMAEMVKTICEALSISSDENCESRVFSSDHVTGIMPNVYFGMG